MPGSRQLISSQVLSTSAASVTFSAIPATFTDLVLRFSSRADTDPHTIRVVFNSNGNGSQTYMWGNGSSASGARDVGTSGTNLYNVNTAGSTSNTFTSGEIYLPSYTASQNKPLSVFYAQENNSSTAYLYAVAGLKSSTDAITSISMQCAGVFGESFVSGSSFFLYGIKSDGTV